MIYGIGTDIVSIARMKATLERQPKRFLEKILGVEELIEYHRRTKMSQDRGTRFLATRFSAKEAFFKAVSKGMNARISWHSIQIANLDDGRPEIIFENSLAVWMKKNDLTAQVSLSDEKDFVIAFVVIEHTLISTNESKNCH